MIPEVKIFCHRDHCLPSVAISSVPQVLENLDLHERLMVESLFVPDELDSNMLASLPVEAFQNYSKGSFA
jgi:hypothetical protein